jgi:hypothetical protein
MRPVLQHLADARFNTTQSEEPQERTGIRPREDKRREKEVDPEAVKESFKEAELDPTTERDPGEGKPAG